MPLRCGHMWREKCVQMVMRAGPVTPFTLRFIQSGTKSLRPNARSVPHSKACVAELTFGEHLRFQKCRLNTRRQSPHRTVLQCSCLSCSVGEIHRLTLLVPPSLAEGERTPAAQTTGMTHATPAYPQASVTVVTWDDIISGDQTRREYVQQCLQEVSR